MTPEQREQAIGLMVSAPWHEDAREQAGDALDALAPLLAEERRAGAEQALRGAAVATMPSDTDSRCRASLSRWLVVRADRIAQDQP